jgi:hypothetical protein
MCSRSSRRSEVARRGGAKLPHSEATPIRSRSSLRARCSTRRILLRSDRCQARANPGGPADAASVPPAIADGSRRPGAGNPRSCSPDSFRIGSVSGNGCDSSYYRTRLPSRSRPQQPMSHISGTLSQRCHTCGGQLLGSWRIPRPAGRGIARQQIRTGTPCTGSRAEHAQPRSRPGPARNRLRLARISRPMARA